MSATIATPTPLQLQIRVAPEAPRTRWRATTCRARPASLPDAQVVTGRKGVSEYVEAAQQLTRWPDGGPPRWFSPLECGGAGGRISGAPTLLYLPGIDGVGLGLIRHHEALAKIFVLWCLHIPVKDRTSFEGLVEYVERTVKLESSRAPDRPVYLVGESIGACIALAGAARNRDTDLVLILVNPGTSFHKSKLQSLSAFLDLIPEPFHLNSPEFLNFLTENFMQMLLTFIGRGTYLEEGGQALSEFLVDVLPRETIVWKLQMLRIASSFVNSRLHAVRAQTLVLASGYDVLLPSREEAQRLQSMLENCRVRHFRDNGHTILLINAENKGKEVVQPMDKGKKLVPHTTEEVSPTNEDVVLEEPPSGKHWNYGHYHKEGGPTHFCKVILAPKLECIPMLLDFTKHFPVVSTEFKLKMNTSCSWRVTVKLMNGRVTLNQGWATFVAVH
nr:acyltransferase-like protein At1g54570, chloroplastic [Aegilops tauschii subsp. strangulata]